MKKIKLKLQFNGSNFFGWQVQGDNQVTAQGTLESCLKIIYKKYVKTVGSGRTDAKVHSLDHHVIFTPPFNIPTDSLVKALNSHLPTSIRILSATHLSDDLNITRDVISREYRYLFTNNAEANAFQSDIVTNISFELNIDQMRKALEIFKGTYDFTDFHTKGSDPSTTVRTIFDTELIYIETNTHGIFPDHYCIRIVGSGFLKQMVRLIVSCVWSVGRGKLSIEDIQSALQKPSGKHLAPVAPAQGLFKYKVIY